MPNLTGTNHSSIGFGNTNLSGVIFHGYIGVSNRTSTMEILPTYE